MQLNSYLKGMKKSKIVLTPKNLDCRQSPAGEDKLLTQKKNKKV